MIISIWLLGFKSFRKSYKVEVNNQANLKIWEKY